MNVVAPGAIDTRMSAWIHGPGGKETLAQVQALPGIGQAAHIAGVVAFLAGPDGAWTTGEIVDASGGTNCKDRPIGCPPLDLATCAGASSARA